MDIRKTFKQFIDKQKEKVQKCFIWLTANKDTVIPLITATVTLTTGMAAADIARKELQIKLKDRKTYLDPTTNIKWDLNRSLSTTEKLELAKLIRDKKEIESFLVTNDLLK